MLALPEILVVLRGPDPHSCLLCLQGAERKIRDEERKQSKRKGKCVGPIPRECQAAAVSCSPSLDPAACGLDWGESDMASTSTKAFPSSCGGGQALTHRTAGHVLGGLRHRGSHNYHLLVTCGFTPQFLTLKYSCFPHTNGRTSRCSSPSWIWIPSLSSSSRTCTLLTCSGAAM